MLELHLDVKERVGRDRMSGHIASFGGNISVFEIEVEDTCNKMIEL